MDCKKKPELESGALLECKRQRRNWSEKRRRDAFNSLISELAAMVTTGDRKLDKSLILQQTITFLKNAKDSSVVTYDCAGSDKWKPPFLTDEEFRTIVLEESIRNTSLFDLVDKRLACEMRKLLSRGPCNNTNDLPGSICVSGTLKHAKGFFVRAKFTGEFTEISRSSATNSGIAESSEACFLCKCCFDGDYEPELYLSTYPISTRPKYTCRLNLEWRFIQADKSVTAIVGYTPLELLGTSGYDYIHPNDLDSIAACHKLLMENGEGVSEQYRFLTKGNRWVWLKTKYYIAYQQLSSNPEYVECTNILIGLRSDTQCSSGKNSFFGSPESRKKKLTVKQEEDIGIPVKPYTLVSSSGRDVQRPQPGVSIEHVPIVPGLGLKQISTEKTTGPDNLQISVPDRSGGCLRPATAESEMEEQVWAKVVSIQTQLQERWMHQYYENQRLKAQLSLLESTNANTSVTNAALSPHGVLPPVSFAESVPVMSSADSANETSGTETSPSSLQM